MMFSEAYHYERTADRLRSERFMTNVSIQSTFPVSQYGSVTLLAGYIHIDDSGMRQADVDPFNIMARTTGNCSKNG